MVESQMEIGCVFYMINNGDVEAEILHRDEVCFAIKDISPAAPVHLLVIPVKHLTHIESINADDMLVFPRMFEVAQDLANDKGVLQTGYRLVVNQRDDSGQMIPHLHLHILGGEKLGSMV